MLKHMKIQAAIGIFNTIGVWGNFLFALKINKKIQEK